MKIEAGRYYRTRRGTVAGPMKATNPKTYWVWVCNGTTWTANGRYYGDNEESAVDLISEVYVSDTPPAAKATEDQLREMMRDPRYWRTREPEFVKRVTEGFRALVGCGVPPAAPPADALAPEAKTLCDEFAMAGLIGVLACPGFDHTITPQQMASDAYLWADAMMEARKK